MNTNFTIDGLLADGCITGIPKYTAEGDALIAAKIKEAADAAEVTAGAGNAVKTSLLC